MRPNPCYNNGQGCDERRVGCHIDCHKYKEWREEYDAIAAERRRLADEQSLIFEQYGKYKKKRTKYKR